MKARIRNLLSDALAAGPMGLSVKYEGARVVLSAMPGEPKIRILSITGKLSDGDTTSVLRAAKAPPAGHGSYMGEGDAVGDGRVKWMWRGDFEQSDD